MAKSVLTDWRRLARFGRDRKAGPATEFAIIGDAFFLDHLRWFRKVNSLTKSRVAERVGNMKVVNPVSLVGKFRRERRAATAVEFAIIGATFFVFIFAIFVVSIDLFWQLTLDDAVRNATRQVQIGNIKTGGDFVAAVCSEFGAAAPNCTGSLQYSVQGGAYFGSGGIVATNFGSDGNLGSTSQFSGVSLSSSTGETLLLAQVAYPLPFRVLLLPAGVATENGTSSLYSVVSSVMSP